MCYFLVMRANNLYARLVEMIFCWFARSVVFIDRTCKTTPSFMWSYESALVSLAENGGNLSRTSLWCLLDLKSVLTKLRGTLFCMGVVNSIWLWLVLLLNLYFIHILLCLFQENRTYITLATGAMTLEKKIYALCSGDLYYLPDSLHI